VREEWRFEEGDYQAWISEMIRAAEQGPAPATNLGSDREAPEVGTTPEILQGREMEPLPDDIWGEARARFQDRIPQPVFDTWLRPTWLDRVTESEVRVRTENSFAPGWISRWKNDLDILLTEILGRPVELVVRCGETPDLPEQSAAG
jgi:hypothetical protein